jgi:AraC-like DNA-binding protein
MHLVKPKVASIVHVSDARVQRAIEAILAAPSQPWTVIELSKMTGLSASRFRSVFNRHTGCCPHAFIDCARMTFAMSLLDGHASVKEAAAQIGLDVSHFNRKFRARFGVSPGAYRIRHRSAVDSATK